MSEFINNQSLKKQKLKEALRLLHEGKPMEEIQVTFKEILRNASSVEIAEIEQTLIAEGLPVEDITYLCDAHVALFKESLEQESPPEMQPGHPIFTFRSENELAGLVLNDVKNVLRLFKENPDAEIRSKTTNSIKKLSEFDRHYLRKENLLFPNLERYGFSGPSSVMWGVHDQIRRGWKAMLATLKSEKPTSREMAIELDKEFAEIENAMHEMFYKEDRILFPNAITKLNHKDWEQVYEGESEFGYAFAQRGSEWHPENEKIASAPTEVKLVNPNNQERNSSMSNFPLKVGDLSLSQISLMLTHLPVDITYVDEHDEVRFYSETPDRIFKRTPAIIGRKVQNCHPPASVDKVLRIVEDFKAGKRDHADFWIQMAGKFIHIRYFAIHDEEGKYRGTLEVSQDVTEIRKLEGERRLLED